MMNAINSIFCLRLGYSLYDQLTLKKIRNGTTNQKSQEAEVKANALALRMNVSKKITVACSSVDNFEAVQGVLTNRSGILIPPSWIDEYSSRMRLALNPYLENFFLAHELAHIKHKDTSTQWVERIAIVIATNALYFFTSSNWIFILMPISFLFLHYGMVLKEQNADVEACKYTTDIDKLAAIEDFKRCQAEILYYRNEMPASFIKRKLLQLMFDGEGNYRPDTHPKWNERIKTIEATLEDKTRMINFIGLSIRTRYWIAKLFINSNGFIRGFNKTRQAL